MSNLWKGIKDYWVLIGIIGSGIYSAIDSARQLSEYGFIKNEWGLGVGVILFIVFVAIGVLKMAKKNRDLEQKAEKDSGNKLPLPSTEVNITSNNQSGGVTAGKIEKLVIQGDKKKRP